MKEKRSWSRLDNAAKIFPPTSGKNDSKVFRFSCELKEEIDQANLQKALDKTLEKYPVFLTVLKRGAFWYYLESSDLKAKVKEENTQVCTALYNKNIARLLFSVTYYRKRINLEVFHALSDGAGALQFLRELVCAYIVIVHRNEFGDEPPTSGFDGSITERMEDSFQRYYDPKKKKRTFLKSAYKIKGLRLSEGRIKVIEGIMPVDKLLEIARGQNTTITILITSVLIKSIYDRMTLRERKKAICIAVPVNLRKHFKSESVRNFFAVSYVRCDFKGREIELDDVIKEVAKRFKENLTQEKLSNTMNSLISMEHNYFLRAIPLVIKDFGMKIGYDFNENFITGSLSNVGVVEIPEEFSKYIRLFDVMTSTKKLQVCMCSYKNNMVVNFTDTFVSSDIQKNFFRTLTSMGIPVEIVANPLD